MSAFKGRILCTEDDPDSREMLVFILTDAGYEVEGTDSAADALVRAKNGLFDLFLVDNWMPEMSGDVLTREIRKFNLSTPVLFYSGAGFDADKQSATDAGAQGYLVKPEGIADLVDEVARLIAEAQATILGQGSI